MKMSYFKATFVLFCISQEMYFNNAIFMRVAQINLKSTNILPSYIPTDTMSSETMSLFQHDDMMTLEREGGVWFD